MSRINLTLTQSNHVRTSLLVLALIGFTGLGIIDLMHGNYKQGSAALLLVAVNALLLT